MIMQASTLAAIALLNSAGWLPSGHRWSNQDIPVPYCISANATNTNRSAAQQRAAVTAAIDSWRAGVGLSCTTYNATAQPAANCNAVQNSQDGQNNIFWENNWNQGSGTIGVTWSQFFGNCGNVTDDLGNFHNLQCSLDADIEFNDVHFFWDSAGNDTDIQSISVHEYGHFIGLDHCNDNGTCQIGTGVMYAAYPGGMIRQPTNDDVQGGCGLYPGTPGGLHWPCAGNNDCSAAPICVNPGPAGYCTQTCGNCPAGYICDTNPQNAAQTVCLVDDGLNRDLCEVCQAGFPDACANNGECFTGIPETNVGRCAIPCPNPAAPQGGCPNLYDCYGVQNSSTDYCFPRSSDCTDLNNFVELQLGQSCDGDPVCASGLECIGICTPACTGGPGQGTCPSGYACETFNFQSGPESFCAPPVNEGQSCNGVKACTTGPCLSVNNQATCYRDCEGNPNACNNAQTCNTYQLSGGGMVSICEPPGVPPRPDAGIPPDSGQVEMPDAGCTDPSCEEMDAGMMGGEDAMVSPVEDAGNTMPKPDAGTVNVCRCDVTFACDPGCNECDPECGACTCDESFACDPGCDDCDPECSDRGGGSCGCTSTGQAAGHTSRDLVLFGLFAGALAVLGLRRIVR